MQTQKRQLKDYIPITLKGIAMGAADVVPGVSGGTIAFISGIYDELLGSINKINFGLIKDFKIGGIKRVWTSINGNFLLALGLGIIISILSLAKMLSWLLEHQPILLWSFFFGLVVSSILLVIKQVKKWNYITFFSLILGVFSAYFITELSPSVVVQPSGIYLFFSGALAICAMILPGISGSFILVLLGVYGSVLAAIHQMNFKTIFWVAFGAIVGLLSFSRLLKFFLTKFHNVTLALLSGFILGSLNKIWPWKKVLETTLIEGKNIVLKDKNVLPQNFEGNPQILMAILLMLIGFLVIIILEKWANKLTI